MSKFVVMLMSSVVAVFCICPVYGAETNVSLSANVCFDFVSKYVGSSGSVSEDGPAIQPSFTLTHESGIYASIWNSTGFRESLGDEVDYSIGWTGEKYGFGINIGVSYYDFVKLFHGRSGNVWASYGELCRNVNVGNVKFVPSVRIEGDFAEADTEDFSDGWSITPGIRCEKEFAGINFWDEILLTYDNGTFGNHVTTTPQNKIGLDFDVCGVTVSPNLLVSLPSDKNRTDEVVWGISVSHDF
jgi:hypothetical protein